jgi:DNA excision repair protein ERCC-4
MKRLPGNEAAELVVLVDSREQSPPEFPPGVTLERATLGEGDYSTHLLRLIAVIERKSLPDFTSTLSWGRERFDREIQRLQSYRWRAVVIEGDISDACAGTRVHPNAVLGTVASLFARWDVPCLFAGNSYGSGRLIAGVLRRLEEKVSTEKRALRSQLGGCVI